MKGTISDTARKILQDKQATEELLDIIVRAPEKEPQPRVIKLKGHTYEVTSGSSMYASTALAESSK